MTDTKIPQQVASNDEATRSFAIEALKKWWLPIPESLRQDFLDYQYRKNVQFMLLINIIGHLAYFSYVLADYLIATDIFVESLMTRTLFMVSVLPLSILFIRKSKNIALMEMLLPMGILLAAILWMNMLLHSHSEVIPTYLYASVIFVVLLNIGIRVNFYTALVFSMVLSAIILYFVFQLNHGDMTALFVYTLVCLPVLWFSLFISWYNSYTGRRLYLHSILDDLNKLELKEANDKLLVQSRTDSLTGINNRSLFEDRTQQAILQARRDKYGLALMYIDLDRFKPINDTYGHAVGDLVLIEAARRMVSSVRESDTVARIGGDEFVVLLPSITDQQAALTVAEKIRTALAQPFELGGTQLQIGSSIGVAIYPEHGTHQDTLAKNGDAALYRAKALGRNRVEMAST
ncbi:MAG: diguanylate cyclase [Sideroxydans sp.]|jgi:diguanylate cyclase (GGDEF)-like protein